MPCTVAVRVPGRVIPEVGLRCSPRSGRRGGPISVAGRGGFAPRARAGAELLPEPPRQRAGRREPELLGQLRQRPAGPQVALGEVGPDVVDDAREGLAVLREGPLQLPWSHAQPPADL